MYTFDTATTLRLIQEHHELPASECFLEPPVAPHLTQPTARNPPRSHPGRVSCVPACSGRPLPGRVRAARLQSSTMALRVVFADDNYLVREGVAALLAEVDDIELVDAVADPQSLLKSVAEHQPDAVLTDIRMPPTFTTEGIDAAKRIRADYPSIGVVVLSQYVEEDYAFELLADGVGRARLPAQGAGVRARRARPGAARRRPRWLGPRPQGRRGADGAQGERGEVAAARPHRPRARGAGGDGDRAQQRHHRQDAVHERAGGREAHRRRCSRSSASSRRARSTAGSWPCSRSSKPARADPRLERPSASGGAAGTGSRVAARGSRG